VSEGNATALAGVVIAELVNQGVTELVLAPGARSAPLAYEALAADRIGLLRLHVRLDERAAGFLALGLAKGSGRPVAVLTTSGTAVANLHPAVLEASAAYQPLVLLTASRPRALVHTGANQTADQDRLFGVHARAYAALTDATADPRTWRFETVRLVAAASGARTRRPGPVQLNIELSGPLTPTGFAAAPMTTDVTVTAAGTADPPTELVAGPQTVMVAGDATPAVGRAVAELGAAAGVPVLAEDVERVVVFGHPTLSRPVGRLLARDDVELVVVTPYPDWVDPGRAATLVTSGVRFAGPASSDWLSRWQLADVELRAELDRLLAGLGYLSGPALAATLWAGLSSDEVLFVGSSSPVRDLDLAPVRDAPPTVYANRGLAGIDGNTSTAAGIALATGSPTTALVGDLTALHDLTGLLRPATEPRADLRVVVANDGGGSIFATLEPGEPAHSAAYERLFGTPHAVDFSAIAAGTGVDYVRVTDVDGLTAVLAEPPRGVTLVEAVVDRSQRRTLNAAITGLAATL
jgi:2-succinyl-5-enolpyruvyl-6-hydroxy-3-cyclohexene-1-carboxylate synthase